MKLTTTSKELPIDKAILKELQRYDLSGNVTYDCGEAIGQGGYSEVFRGIFNGEVGQIDVAVKRMRFHVKTTDCKLVSARYPAGPAHIDSQRSYSSAKYMCGRSSGTRISCRFWASPFAQIPETHCSSPNGCMLAQCGSTLTSTSSHGHCTLGKFVTW